MASITSRRSTSRASFILGVRLGTLLIAFLLMVLLYLRMFVLPGFGVPDEHIIDGRTVTRRHPEKLYKVHNDTRLPT